MDELEDQLTRYLVADVNTMFVGKFQDDMAADIFLSDLAKEITSCSWIEFRYNGEVYQMYLTKVE
jgi:hypothetical protein